MNEEEKISKRVKEILGELGITPTEMAREIGLHQGNFSNALHGKRKIPQKGLIGIANRYNYSLDWIMTGKGDKKSQIEIFEEPQAVEYSKIKEVSPTDLRPNPKGNVIYLPVSAENAMMTGLPAKENIPLERYSLPGLENGTHFLIHNVGDAMYPTFSNGDLIAIQRIELDDLYEGFIFWGEPYVIITKYGKVTKRIREGEIPSEIILESDNGRYDPVVMKKERALALFIIERNFTGNLGLRLIQDRDFKTRNNK